MPHRAASKLGLETSLKSIDWNIHCHLVKTCASPGFFLAYSIFMPFVIANTSCQLGSHALDFTYKHDHVRVRLAVHLLNGIFHKHMSWNGMNYNVYAQLGHADFGETRPVLGNYFLTQNIMSLCQLRSDSAEQTTMSHKWLKTWFPLVWNDVRFSNQKIKLISESMKQSFHCISGSPGLILYRFILSCIMKGCES